MPRGVEIQGNLTFSPGTRARQIVAMGGTMLHKVHVWTNGVGGGHYTGVQPKPKAKVQWIPRRGQPQRWDKATIKDGASWSRTRGLL